MKLATLSALFICLATQFAAAQTLEKTDLFNAGENGYETFRVPGMVVTGKGSILVYCEGRRGSASDWADIDILLRRSTDGGKTWSAPQNVVDIGTDTINNFVAFVDRDGGRIHFLYCVNYARCFYMFSDDDGVTLSKAVEITAAFEPLRKEYAWKILATGPGHGIQLKNGRLLVPVWLSTADHEHRPSAVSTIYSDDHGKSWHTGEIVCAHPDPLVNPSETLAVQLSDGRVLLNIRSENKDYKRAISISEDGATNWSPIRFDESLFEPICMAALIPLPEPFADNDSTFVFTNPDSHANPKVRGKASSRMRENVTVRLSYDDCKTWPISRVLDPGISGYTDLAIGPDGAIYCIYERGGDKGFAHKHLTLAKFDRKWVEGK